MNIKKLLALSSWLLALIIISGCEDRTLHKESRILMGTFVEVISPDERAANIAFEEIEKIECLLSKYKDDSELARLNQLGELKVSPQTLFIINQAKIFYNHSNGAFDITIGVLMDIWGFTDMACEIPGEREIEEALKLVGFDKIIIDEENNFVKLGVEGMKIDLGAIAKGYAVDCAVKKLRQAGIKSCLINAGGDIYCLGDKFGTPWRVAIQDPRKNGFVDYLDLKDKAVATSGDYEQYFLKQKKRYSHIFNPRTGYPADSKVVSVSVVADDCLTADALTTSIFILGKQEGLKLAQRLKDLEVEIIEEKDVPDNQ